MHKSEHTALRSDRYDRPLDHCSHPFNAILGIFASWAVFALRGVTLTGDATGASDPEILNLLLQTPAGNTLLLHWRLFGALVFCASWAHRAH